MQLLNANKLTIAKWLQLFKAPDRSSSQEWVETNVVVGNNISPAMPGDVRMSKTPWMIFVLDCLDDPSIKIIVGQKSAQIGWSFATLIAWLGKKICIDQQNIMIAFPTDPLIVKFWKEKFVPFINSTPVVKAIIGDVKRQKISYKHIPIGSNFIAMANMRTPTDLISSSVETIIVEEPGQVQDDVGKQGDTFDIISQRMKTIENSKFVYAGTPTKADFCPVEKAFKKSNQLHFQVICHLCGAFHPLSFENLKYKAWNDRRIDKLYGLYDPSTACYECPHCNTAWSFDEKNENVLKSIEYSWMDEDGINSKGWKPENPDEKEIFGFAFCELLSPFQPSNFIELAKRQLSAMVAYEQGNENPMKSWINNAVGEAYAPISQGLAAKDLVEKRLNYTERLVPRGVIGLTCGIDVQHNRFALVVRGWGRNNCSWGILWTELFGDSQKCVLDGSNAIWGKLADFITQDWQHENGKTLRITRTNIDCGDGSTAELVYRFVQTMQARGYDVQAVKGWSDRGDGEVRPDNKEIYTDPHEMLDPKDHQALQSLAASMGVTVYMMGSYRAHTEILRRYNLTGALDRYYHCEFSYPNYEDQILGCRSTYGVGARSFKLIPGKRKEAIDCEKMALHAAYGLLWHNYSNYHWDMLERQIFG